MFRFTIRELVLLTLVVAMGVGWWLDHNKQANLVQLLQSDWDIERNAHRFDIQWPGHSNYDRIYPTGSPTKNRR